MEFLIIFLCTVMIMYGVILIINPIRALSLSDVIRLKGKRTYSRTAITMARIGGSIVFSFGIYLIFLVTSI